MNPTDTIDTTTRNLRCKLTDKELLENGKLLSENNFNVRQLEEDKKRVMADYGAKVKAEKALASPIEAKIRTGYEFRDIECSIEWDLPRKGWKTLARSDTSEKIEEELTPSEKQKRFDFMKEMEASHLQAIEEMDAETEKKMEPEIPAEVKALKRKARK